MKSLKPLVVKGAFAAILLSGVVASADAVSAASVDIGNNLDDDTSVQARDITKEDIRESVDCECSSPESGYPYP